MQIVRTLSPPSSFLMIQLYTNDKHMSKPS
jgi:hypothetical protein